MAHTIQNNMSVQSNTITLPTAGTYVEQDIIVQNNVNPGSLTNAPAGNETYTENTSTSTVLPANGYLYINKGWHDNTKISLGHLIPEIADNDAGDEHILYGYKAYDENGNVITGTMAEVDPTFSGGGITATAGGSVATAPKVTITQSITSAAATTFGFTANKPSGTEGTNYLKIDAGGTPTDGSVTATANASSSAVVFATAVSGMISKAANDVARAGQSATQATKAITVTPTVTDNAAPVYVPVVNPTFAGGTVNGSASVEVERPAITLSSSASNNASTYGVTTTEPSSGSYVTISTAFDPTKGKAHPSGSASRGAVTFSNSAGAIKANSGATALAASSATTLTGNPADIDIAVTSTSLKSHYIPVVTPAFDGGGVSGKASVEVVSPTVTVSTSMSTGAADYGVTTNRPSGEYISINVSQSSSDGTATASADATRDAVTFTNSAGAIKANNGATALAASAAVSLTEAEQNIRPTVNTADFKSHYIPKATIKAVPGAPSITKPTASASVAVADNAGASVSGVLSSAPTSGDYITITPSVSTTAGSAISNASAAANSAGVITASTTGGTVSGTAATVSVTNNTPTTAARYIKIYDGSYTIS